MPNETTLKQALTTYTKKELVIIAENQGIKSPNKLKKAELIQTLEKWIPKQFEEDVLYFTAEELIVYLDNFDQLLQGISPEEFKEAITDQQNNPELPNLFEKTDEIIPPDFLETLDKAIQIQNHPQEIVVTNDNAEDYRYLFSRGYAFVSAKNLQVVVKIPVDLKDLLMNKMKSDQDEMYSYQTLQMYIFSLSNLYGVCSYHQLHQVFKKYTDSSLSLKKVRDYTLSISKKSELCQTTDDYLYNMMLTEEEADIIVESDLKRPYYFPKTNEIEAYCHEFMGPEGNDIFQELKELILNKTKISYPTELGFTWYDDALQRNNETILNAFENILDKLMFYAKMGYGLIDFIKILDLALCKFDSIEDMNKAYSLYQELMKKTRKWPLKGHLYSEL